MAATNHELPVHTRHVLAHGLGRQVSVTDFRCRACRHPLSEEECNVEPSIVFVRRGLFVRSQDGVSVMADTSRILFFNPQQPYRISHPIEGGDDCTILTISRPLALEIVARHTPHVVEQSSWVPFLQGEGRAALDLWRMHYELLARSCADELGFEDLLLRIIEKTVAEAHGGASGDQRMVSRSVRHRTARRHGELAHAAVMILNRNLARPPSLVALSDALGCSPYHLSRVFREVNGFSLRGYLATARARAAADAIVRGVRNLTDLALRLGYADHSHFTNAFNREWKTSPSEFRAMYGGARPGRRH
jgi:AraC family transcriptional regulator